MCTCVCFLIAPNLSQGCYCIGGPSGFLSTQDSHIVLFVESAVPPGSRSISTNNKKWSCLSPEQGVAASSARVVGMEEGTCHLNKE